MAYISGGITEIQQLRAELEQIKQIIAELEPKLERMPRQLSTFKELEAVARRYLLLARRLGLPEDVDNAVRFLSRVLVILRQIQITAMSVAAGPAGLFMAIPTMGLTVLTIAEGY